MKFFEYFAGILLCVAIAFLSIIISKYIPIGSVATAIILGIIIGNLIKLKAGFDKGIAFSEKHILSFAIALLGVNLNFTILSKLGYKSIILIVVAITLTLFISVLVSKLLKFDTKFGLLIGIGNGICGSSAIAATEKIIGVKKEEVGLSVAIVNFLGTIGIFLLPLIATMFLKLSDINGGILIGNTLQAVGQVVAAGFSINDLAGQTATIVKMTRILMLFPIVLILILIFSKNKKETDKKTKLPAIPIFIIGFILFSLIPTFEILPQNIIKIISKLSHYALIIAMAGIGLKITFQSIMNDGKSALLVGTIIFLFQILFSGIVVFLFFNF
jgi:uncharacterized integral membrane protein (TIGR00698 family)